MHVLSYFCIFVIYGTWLGAGIRPSRAGPTRPHEVDAPRARAAVPRRPLCHAGSFKTGPEPERRRPRLPRHRLRHAGLDRRHHHDFLGRRVLQRPVRTLCGNQISGAPRHRRDVFSVAASARWRGDSTPSTRHCPRGHVGSMATQVQLRRLHRRRRGGPHGQDQAPGGDPVGDALLLLHGLRLQRDPRPEPLRQPLQVDEEAHGRRERAREHGRRVRRGVRRAAVASMARTSRTTPGLPPHTGSSSSSSSSRRSSPSSPRASLCRSSARRTPRPRRRTARRTARRRRPRSRPRAALFRGASPSAPASS